MEIAKQESENLKKNKNQVTFSIFLNKEKKIIWNISLNNFDKLSRNSEFWIAIFEESKLWKWYWTEAMKLI